MSTGEYIRESNLINVTYLNSLDLLLFMMERLTNFGSSKLEVEIIKFSQIASDKWQRKEGVFSLSLMIDEIDDDD